MALAEIRFYSQAVGISTAMNVIIPDGRGPFPVLYLLHGLSDDHTIWCRRTALERYLEGTGLMVVMPVVWRGWYINAARLPGARYEDMILQDLIPFVERVFPVSRKRSGRGIGGLSMGGYGAVRLALKRPDLFASVHSHSGALMGAPYKMRLRPPMLPDRQEEFRAIFGPKWRGSDKDPVALARKCPMGKRPALRIDCGTGDYLLYHNRDFHAVLDGLNYPHEYQEFAGGHTWDYWDAHIQEAISFHLRHLKR